MVDSSAMGRTGEPFTMEVERGKIREFARATRSANAEYLDAPDPFAPPTFLTTASFWTPDAYPWLAVDMDQSRGLHAEQEYVFHGPPPRAGARLRGQSTITDIFTKDGRRAGPMTFVVMTTQFRDPEGTLVAESTMTGVETTTISSSPSPGGADLGPSVASGSPNATLGPRSAEAGSGEHGEPGPLVVGPLTRTDLVIYQGASGDFNPIHHDEPFAVSTGLPRPLSLGMLQAGILATWATDWLGAAAVRRYRVRFAEQVFPGDTVTCSGDVVKSYVVDGEPRVDLELRCTTQTGAVALRAWATFVNNLVARKDQA